MAKKKKIENEHDFYYPSAEIHLYDADSFISQVKHMMVEAVPDTEFAIYFGVNENDCLDIWIRDENGIMYQIQPKNLGTDDSEISLAEALGDEEDDVDWRN